MQTEDNFTHQRTELCPHPEYWHAPDSEATEHEVSEFVGSLVRIIQPELVVETGTYHGHTAYEIGKALYRNQHGRLDTTECDERAYNTAVENIEKWRIRDGYHKLPINLIFGDTLRHEPDQPIGFAFFDSWMEGRIQEFLRYRDLGFLKPRTIVAFHDSAPHHKLLTMLTPLEDRRLIKFLFFDTPRGLALGQVL